MHAEQTDPGSHDAVMATASRRARKTSRHSHWPTATGHPSEAKVLPGPATITEDAPQFQGASLTQPGAHAATGRRVVVPRPPADRDDHVGVQIHMLSQVRPDTHSDASQL